MNNIFNIVSIETKYTKDALSSKSRNSDLVNARVLFVALSRKACFTFPQIAKELSRDHTTIIHLFKKSKNLDWVSSIMDKYKNNLTIKDKIISVKLKGRYGYLHQLFNGKCVVCGFDEVCEVHHIIPRHLGGDDDKDNLVLLCPNHHALADRGMLEIKDIHSFIKKSTFPQS